MTKIAFLCSRFGGGGAEMHLLRIMNAADLERYEIHLLLTRDEGNYERLLDPRIRVHYLSKNIRSSTYALALAYGKLGKYLRRIDPRLVVSFMDSQNVLLASLKRLGLQYPIVLCCQNAPAISLRNSGVIGKSNAALLPVLYPLANRIIAICQGVKNDLTQTFSLDPQRIKVIYNAGFDDSINTLRQEEISEEKYPLQLVACGRLTKQKGFDILLRALAMVKLDFHLWLLGTGTDEGALKQLARELKLDGRIAFLGFKANPYAYFSKADLFVLSSRWEGFGNVITEAMRCGTPVLSTSCPFGPDEIIEHGVSGWLVAPEDPEVLAAGIVEILADPQRLQLITENGTRRAKDFRAPVISQAYFELFEAVIRKHNRNETSK